MSEREFLIQMGKKIAAKRKAKRLSQLKLSRLAGLHRGGLSLIENGHSGSMITTLKRIANCLNCDVKDFL